MKDDFSSPYPDYDVLDKWDGPSWNEPTREVVAKRLTEVPTRSFFTEEEWRTLEAVCGRLLPQPDRPDEPVPIVPWIDRQLARNQGNGYRYEDMPPTRQAWRLGLQGIEDESRRRFGQDFRDLHGEKQDAVLEAIQKGEVEGEVWRRLPAQKFFKSTLLESVVSIYYSHPAAWSEIGYGGPASPRGYVRLGVNQRDPWEAEARHD